MPILDDGFKTLVTIQGVTAKFEEIEVTPPSVDSGGGIDMTTMRNTRYRTKLGKALLTLDTISIKVAYDPIVYSQMIAFIGQNRHVTIQFPDGGTLTFYAIISKFSPDALKEGERPEATLELEPSNLSTANPAVEIAPVFTTGTTATTTTTAIP